MHREARGEGNSRSTALTAPRSPAMILVLMISAAAFSREDGALDRRTRVGFPKGRELRLSLWLRMRTRMFPMAHREAKGEGALDRRPSLRSVPQSLFVL